MQIIVKNMKTYMENSLALETNESRDVQESPM